MGRLIVNGFVLPLVKNMKLKLEMDSDQEIESITLDVSGGKLTVENKNGPAMTITGKDKGCIYFIGKDCALMALNETPATVGATITFDVLNQAGIKI